MCAIVSDIRVASFEHVQEVFMFNATKPSSNGVVFRNEGAHGGKYITSILPINNSPYLVIAFGTSTNWAGGELGMLLRLDYFDTERQFTYDVKTAQKGLTCFRTLYIEYTNYFVASFSEDNGVLMYDITQTSKAPYKVFHPEGVDHEHIAYLEFSTALLVNVLNYPRIYGYALHGNKLYQIETIPYVHGLVAFKSSNFFAVFSERLIRKIYVYNLEGMVHLIELERSAAHQGVVFSEFFGNLFLLHDNYAIRMTSSRETMSPSCLEGPQTAPYAFSSKICQKCASGAAFTRREICEFKLDSWYLVYQSSKVPHNFPTNTKGQRFVLPGAVRDSRGPVTPPPPAPSSSSNTTTNTTETNKTNETTPAPPGPTVPSTHTPSEGGADYTALIISIVALVIVGVFIAISILCFWRCWSRKNGPGSQKQDGGHNGGKAYLEVTTTYKFGKNSKK